jgi:hypothetical protein
LNDKNQGKSAILGKSEHNVAKMVFLGQEWGIWKKLQRKMKY